MFSLIDEICKNENLQFVDDLNHGRVIPIKELEFISIPVEKKNIAFLYLDNSFQSVRVLLSFLKSNHTIALLSPSLKEHFKLELETLYKPLFIYDTTRSNLDEYSTYLDFLYRSNTVNSVSIHEEVKVLLSTSGTTGSPKFVKLSENNLYRNALSIIRYLPIEGTDVTPLNLPIYYSYGLSVLTSNAIAGGKIVCSNLDVLNKDFWVKFEQYGYSSIAGVPFVYEMLDRIGFTKKQYPSLKYFSQAGGKLQDSLVRKFFEFAKINKVAFYVMYGQTEATARMSYLPPASIEDKIGSIGIPIPDGVFSIDKENGELCYSGPNVFGGYVSSLEDLCTYEQPEILKTGDVARVDSDGYYFITGRLKRFVKLYGNRINLDEIEMLLSKHNGSHLKCTGYQDKFLLLFTTEENFDFKDSTNHLVSELKIHPSAIKTFVLKEYPLTANGKIDYNQVINLYESK